MDLKTKQTNKIIKVLDENIEHVICWFVAEKVHLRGYKTPMPWKKLLKNVIAKHLLYFLKKGTISKTKTQAKD